jgi:hypothetical protein
VKTNYYNPNDGEYIGKEVFCKECKYYKAGLTRDYCLAEVVELKRTPYEMTRGYAHPFRKNMRNRCRDYEPKKRVKFLWKK